MSTTTTAWHQHAACAEIGPAPFELDGYGHQYRNQIAAARAICAGCEVAPECLAEALAIEDLTTIRSGTTPPERAKMLGIRTRRDYA